MTFSLLDRPDKTLGWAARNPGRHTGPLSTETLARFTRFVVDVAGCWIWNGYRNQGYGVFQIKVRKYRAHRVAYEHYIGQVPDGLTLDHLCRDRACVNPAHLQAVTHRENTLRSYTPLAINAAKTECVRGHALSGSNLYITPVGRRQCKTCKYATTNEWRRQQRRREGRPERRRKAA